MGRTSGNIPWHAPALRLQADGLPLSKIMEAFANLPSPPSREAVKKYLARAKQDPAKALQTVAASVGSDPPPRAPLNAEDARVIDTLFVVLEKHRAVTIKMAMKVAREFLATRSMDLTNEDFRKLTGALEVLKVLKTPGEGPRRENPDEDLDGDSGGQTGRSRQSIILEIEGVDPQPDSPTA